MAVIMAIGIGRVGVRAGAKTILRIIIIIIIIIIIN